MALVVVVAWDCEPALCSFVLDAFMPPGHGCRFGWSMVVGSAISRLHLERLWCGSASATIFDGALFFLIYSSHFLWATIVLCYSLFSHRFGSCYDDSLAQINK